MTNRRLHAFGALVAANLLVIGWFWAAHSGHLLSESWSGGGPLVALGRLSGLLLQVTLVLQLLLIGRITFIEQALGFASLNRLHRWIGYSLVLLLMLHPLLMSVGYARMDEQPVPSTFVGFLVGFDDVFKAVLGALLLVGVIAVSVPWVRRKLRYESWHGIHLLTYAAIWLSFGHQTASGEDFANRTFFLYWYIVNGFAFGLYFLYRFVRPFAFWYRHRFIVDRTVQESPDVWSVYITGRNMAQFHYEPGQFATLHFLSRGLWAGHPFSFSREYDGKTLRFTVKALGDGTSLIARITPGVRVIVDGPLGAFTPRHAQGKRFLLIGGGIGITPLRAIAGAVTPGGGDVVVLYGARTLEHMALMKELDLRVRQTHVFLSDETGALPPGVRRGRIDARAIRELVPDVRQRDVYVCGPKAMIDTVISALEQLGVPALQIHSERFAF